MHCFTTDYYQKPYLIAKGSSIIEVSKALLELTGFDLLNFQDKPLEEVWDQLLRISIKKGSIKEREKAFVFTKDLDVRHILIEAHPSEDCISTLYIFTEIPFTQMDIRFPYVMHIFHKEKSRVAIFSAPDLILIRANQSYLECLQEPFNKRENSIGKKIDAISKQYHGGSYKEIWTNLLTTGEDYYASEVPCKKQNGEITYWNLSIVPIYENGVISCFVEITTEVTETVNNRKVMQEQKELIIQQKEALEAIIENMPDAFVIYDRSGHILQANAEARKMLPDLLTKAYASEILHDLACFDLENNLIPFQLLPTSKAFRGEKVKNERIIIQKPDKLQITEVNATPIYDKENQLISVAVSHHDITDYIHSQQQLLQAEKEKNEALESSIIIKDEFLYLITHELKTPLAVISSALQTLDLIYQRQLPEKAAMLLSTIKNNTNRQLRLVNNLLDITKLQAQQIKLHFDVFDIVPLTKAIVDSVIAYAEQKNIAVTFSSELSKKEIIVDDEKYERILLNLISNALKFTPEGKSIHVHIQSRQYKKRSMISIQVKDTGIGIPKNKQQIIFERFGQADTSLSRRSEGTGLGLYLANLFVKALQGEILLTSEEGVGSTFTVLLPAASKEELAAISVVNKNSNHFISGDTRILHSAAIEFSDVNN